MIQLRALACLAAAMAGLTSCALSFSAGSVNDSKFRAVWSPGWTAVNAAAKPLRASAGDPGACNNGGSPKGCVSAGQNMVAALSKLETQLALVETPSEYGAASITIQQGIHDSIKGLTDRNSAIKSHDTRLFTTAITELQGAANLLAKGYAQFPLTTRPTPVPLAGGGSR
jgi:hypothetical protein